jgi:hypothetical protein
MNVERGKRGVVALGFDDTAVGTRVAVVVAFVDDAVVRAVVADVVVVVAILGESRHVSLVIVKLNKPHRKNDLLEIHVAVVVVVVVAVVVVVVVAVG